MLIQFGHNDVGSLNTGRARGSLPGIGEETKDVVMEATGQTETVHSFGWYLRKYVADAQAKGATPILCSLVPRNNWKDGRVIRATDDYVAWTRAVAESARRAVARSQRRRGAAVREGSARTESTGTSSTATARTRRRPARSSRR